MRADLALSRALMVAHEAREEVENIFDAAAEAMLMVDCGTLRILRTNPGAAQLYGYSVRDLEGRPVADLVAGSAIAGDFLRLHRDYVPLRFHRRADGSHMAVEIRIRYCTRNGREVAVLTVRDASERTRSAAAQLESDLRYRTVFRRRPRFPSSCSTPRAASWMPTRRSRSLPLQPAMRFSASVPPASSPTTSPCSGSSSRDPTFLPAGDHVRKDGTRFAAETTVSYVNQRGVSLAILIVRDVTEARETVARLEEAEERWRFALEGRVTACGTGTCGTAASIVRPVGERCSVTPRPSHVAWRGTNCMHPDDRIRVLEQMDAYLHEALPIYESEFRLRSKDGQYRWIAARGKAMARDADGTPVRILGTHRDISQTRSLMETLRASERLWQFALEGHGDALWDWAVETGEINVSASFAAIIGYPADRPLCGNDIWPSRLHPDDLRGAIAAFSAHLSGARPITEAEFRLRMEDGSYRWIALRGKVMEQDASGRSTRMIGTVRDVHDRHLSVEREKQQQRELAHAARLIHVGEMASALAHEINQPLTALRNFSAVALRRLDELESGGEAIRGPLKMIADQALRAGEIVHRVRGFVRKGGLVTAPVAMNEVVRDMVRFAEFDARAHSVQFVLELAELLPPCWLTRSRSNRSSAIWSKTASRRWAKAPENGS
jgi:PAS domain S-box-containing protein